MGDLCNIHPNNTLCYLKQYLHFSTVWHIVDMCVQRVPAFTLKCKILMLYCHTAIFVHHLIYCQ